MASKKTPAPAPGKPAPSQAAAPASLPAAVNAARALLLVAVALTGYLAYASFSSGGVAGCGPEGGCGEVLRSRWAYWLGIPVSVPAGLMYLALLGLTFQVAGNPASASKGAKLGLQAGCIAVIGAAVWFVCLQAFAVGKFCPFCCTTHGVASVAAILLLRWVSPLPGADFTSAFAAAAVALGLVAGGQLAVQPKSFKVAGMSTGGASSNAPVAALKAPAPAPATSAPPAIAQATPIPVPAPAAPAATKPAPAAPSSAVAAVVPGKDVPTLSLHNNRFNIDLTEFPVIGSPKAPKVMVSLFDYTCKYCRATHKPIVAVQHAFSNELAVLSLPMPLDATCNRYVRRTPSAHSNACNFATLALAVWRLDQAKFHTFDEWLLTNLPRVTLEQARLQAAALVGAPSLDVSLQDPWIPKTIQMAIDIYGANNETVRSGNMPQMIIGTNIVAGTLHDDGELFELVERGLGLKLP